MTMNIKKTSHDIVNWAIYAYTCSLLHLIYHIAYNWKPIFLFVTPNICQIAFLQ